MGANVSPNKNEQSALNFISQIKYQNMHVFRAHRPDTDNARCVTVCDSVKDLSIPNHYSSNLSVYISTQPDFKSIIDQLLGFETSKIRIKRGVNRSADRRIWL